MRRTGRRKGKQDRISAQRQLDRERYRKELAEGRENGDATKVAQALNNLGSILTDEGDHTGALDHYEQAIAALAEDATAEDRVVSRGNAAQAARQLGQWEKAIGYALESEALAIKEGWKKTLNELIVSFLAVRRAVGIGRYEELFNAGLAKLPEELRQHVRVDLHLNPTYRKDADEPGRNDPCPCGSGKKYKKCCATVAPRNTRKKDG